MRRPSVARFLAPLSMAAAIAAVVYVVQHSETGEGDAKKPATTATAPKKPTRASQKPKPKRKASKVRTYRVRSGDTLSRIAVRTGVSVAVIEELNPGLDPQTLTVGRNIKLKP
jgi:N-acetylmuramoyl-L-alanine amidase